jgi:alpha-ketoglutaric semialdehyde dehydrogenase
MQVAGNSLIGQRAVHGTNAPFKAYEAATGAPIAPEFGGATGADLAAACALAADAFDLYRETSLEERARFLELIARNIMGLGAALIERCMIETGLPRARIEGERERTVGQLRMFAAVVRDGDFLGLRIDPAQPERKPQPRLELRLRNVPLGPVAVFGASNFPLAFSVAGGDTASALAAGCPVIVKAHAAHPGTSELVGLAVQSAVRECGLPEGTFSLLFDGGFAIGQQLVRDPRIKAVAFTGSRRGGTALLQLAAARAEPIPVYAEMSSVNPVLLFPAALKNRAESIGKEFTASLVQGAGQFCTNPGLVLAIDSPDLDRFISAAAGEVVAAAPATMLTPGIFQAYESAVADVAQHAQVETVARGRPSDGANKGSAGLFATKADAFRRHEELQREIFGASSMVVRCPDLTTMRDVVESLEGQLTCSLQIDPDDYADARTFLAVAERRAGRIVVNGFATGVEVGHAMVHGGPYPATSDSRSTSVGSLAIYRFLRPVSYQNFPTEVLPEVLRDAGLQALPRKLDGRPA